MSQIPIAVQLKEALGLFV